MRILVCGASGWIGRALCATLEHRPDPVIRAVRRSATPGDLAVGDLHAHTPWEKALRGGIDVVVHLAGRVPAGHGLPPVPDQDYFETNTLGTIHLAQQCASHGVSRFIFLSTVKVLGECSGGRPLCGGDAAAPADAYAESKWRAEQALWEIAAGSTMGVVVLRPPLVYGPGVRGNFLRLMRAIHKGHPLPLSAVHNRRSLVFLGNLIDAIDRCLRDPRAVGNSYLVSDGEDISTPELVRRAASALGVRPRMLPVPEGLLRWTGQLAGRRAAVDRLLGSLSVNIEPLREELDSEPPFSLRSGLEATAQWYLGAHA